jgi:hypothetical protein
MCNKQPRKRISGGGCAEVQNRVMGLKVCGTVCDTQPVFMMNSDHSLAQIAKGIWLNVFRDMWKIEVGVMLSNPHP